MTDIMKRLHYACHDPETGERLNPGEFTYATLEDVMEAIQKIEKLRAALDKAADALHDAGCYDAWAAARAALGEKE